MLVKQIANLVFKSNTYIISNPNYNYVWLVDVGEFEKVLETIGNKIFIKGVFITHPHFDHIYGINKLIEHYPDCIVYISNSGNEGLYSEKENLSFYHNDPIVFKGKNIEKMNDSTILELFNDIYIEAIETPGHNLGCLSFKINNFLFTGDSYIPNVEVVTKLKGGDKKASIESVKKIMNLITPKTIICPGHGPMVTPHI